MECLTIETTSCGRSRLCQICTLLIDSCTFMLLVPCAKYADLVVFVLLLKDLYHRNQRTIYSEMEYMGST